MRLINVLNYLPQNDRVEPRVDLIQREYILNAKLNILRCFRDHLLLQVTGKINHFGVDINRLYKEPSFCQQYCTYTLTAANIVDALSNSLIDHPIDP